MFLILTEKFKIRVEDVLTFLAIFTAFPLIFIIVTSLFHVVVIGFLLSMLWVLFAGFKLWKDIP
jgi:hypothetical protein